jgi:hypothetical protein
MLCYARACASGNDVHELLKKNGAPRAAEKKKKNNSAVMS